MNTFRRALLVTAALLGGGLVVVGCSSLEKDALSARLAELPKNAQLVARGVRVDSLRVSVGAREELVELAWIDTGVVTGLTPARPPVVLVHGTPASLFDWAGLIDGGVDSAGDYAGLAASRRVLAPDLPGHGQSVTDADPVDFALCAASLAAWIQQRHVGPVHLVGQSYGGEVVLRVALDHPELVASLTLIDSAGLSRRDDEWLPEERKMRELPGAGFGWLINSRENVRGALQVHFAEPVDEGLVEEMFLLLENAENWGAMVDLARDENGDREPDLPALRAPTLLLWGADDVAYTVDRFARRFERAIPDATLTLLPGVGHYPQHEAPRATLEALQQWFALHD